MKPADWQPAEPFIGAQIRVSRGAYYHHGIYVAEDTVVHYAAADGDGLSHAADVTVRTVPLSMFLAGGNLEIRRYSLRERLEVRPPKRVAAAALGRVGEGGYDILRHNCEDFSNECAFGRRRSGQIDAYRKKVLELLNKP